MTILWAEKKCEKYIGKPDFQKKVGAQLNVNQNRIICKLFYLSENSIK